MEESTSTPVLRFCGFSEDWRIVRLGSVLTILNGFAFSSSHAVESGVRWLKIADVGIHKMKKDNLSYLPVSFTRSHSKFILKKGDCVIALTRPILNSRLKIAMIDDEFDGALLNQRVGKLVTSNHLPFIYYLLQQDRLVTIIESNIAGSDPPNLSPNEINDVRVTLPILAEQEKIASFLTAIDNKIQLLEKKKGLLERYKKGVMQKIFNQEIRFKDDKGNDFPDWEDKLLGEIASFSKGRGISKADIADNGVLECIRYGELYTHYGETIKEVRSRTDADPKGLVLSEVNDVIIPSSGETSIDIATASCVLKNGVALGGDLNIIKSDVDGVFLSYYLNNRKKSEIAALAQGVSVVHLYAKELKTLAIEMPSKTEQMKIANFISMLDEKIGHISRQIELTGQYKKGLLQQMFV